MAYPPCTLLRIDNITLFPVGSRRLCMLSLYGSGTDTNTNPVCLSHYWLIIGPLPRRRLVQCRSPRQLLSCGLQETPLGQTTV